MEPREVLETFETTTWDEAFAESDKARAIAGLEIGKVVFFPHLAFAIAPEEQVYLTQSAGSESRKNVSFDPRTGRIHGTSVAGAEAERLGRMIDRFGQQADALVRGLFPHYGPTLERARPSFRPAEIEGRQYSPRHDDRLMHVDAFPTRPMRGRRILRAFANVAPDGALRAWRVGEPFPDFARKFMPKLSGPMPGQSWIMQQLGLTKSRRSVYDHYMLKLHDAGKLDASYQATAPQAAVTFPPGSVWMCYTDSVLHAAMSGRYALEQTFHLPVSGMARPDLSPLRVLEQIAGRVLV